MQQRLVRYKNLNLANKFDTSDGKGDFIIVSSTACRLAQSARSIITNIPSEHSNNWQFKYQMKHETIIF
jgi:hypothetical protein